MDFLFFQQVMAHSTPQGILDDVAMVSLHLASRIRLPFPSFTWFKHLCDSPPPLGVGWRSRSIHCENVEVIDLWNRGQEDRTRQINKHWTRIKAAPDFPVWPSSAYEEKHLGQLSKTFDPASWLLPCINIYRPPLLPLHPPVTVLVSEHWIWNPIPAILIHC